MGIGDLALRRLLADAIHYAEAGIPVVDIADVTGVPAILDHRVVTLHPRVHGGLLADPTDPSHLADMAVHGIEPIDLVVVNLYPFTSSPGIETIDIGGPAMVRAAAKNHAHVGVVVDPRDYGVVLDEIRLQGSLSVDTRRRLARDAFAAIAAYDADVGIAGIARGAQVDTINIEVPNDNEISVTTTFMATSWQDKADNTTRFFVLGRRPSGAVGNGKDVTSLLVSLGDEAASHSGALLRMLMPLAERGINLSKIESRPSKKRAACCSMGSSRGMPAPRRHTEVSAVSHTGLKQGCMRRVSPSRISSASTSACERTWRSFWALVPVCEEWASSAITTMLLRSDSTGKVSSSSPGMNFWIVVKTTPPDPTVSFARRSARSAAWTGSWRRRSRHRLNVPKSWSSRSLRSVSTTTVGFSIAGSRMMRPA